MSERRCLECGSSKFDPEGYKCGRCGNAMGLREESCYISEETKQTLLDHADELAHFGIKLERRDTLQKSVAGETLTVVGFVIQIVEALRPGSLRDLVVLLRELAIPEDEILRLRLDEPEEILKYYRAPKVVTVTKERDVRIHANLWNTSRCLLQRGREEEKASFHQFMASLVFTAFTLEAYLNWLGSKLFQHWNYLERLSPKEKLAVISDHLKVNVNNSERPWQIVKLLFEFRNYIAHGKPQQIATTTVEPINEHLDAKLGQIARTEWENYCTRENAERAREDVEKILETLHKAADIKGGLGPLSQGSQSRSAVYTPPRINPVIKVVERP